MNLLKKLLVDIRNYGISVLHIYFSKLLLGIRYEYRVHQNQGIAGQSIIINNGLFTQVLTGLSRGSEFNGLVDPLETQFITQYFAKNEASTTRICLDIGANNGYYSCLFASLGGKVFAFEPMPEFQNQLQENIDINEFQNLVQLQQYAVSDANGSISMSDGLVVTSDRVTNATPCKVISLDSWCETRNLINKISFLKIDVEGLEGKVIRGAQKVIEASKPVLLIEISPHTMHSFNDRAADIFNALVQQNYVAYQSPYPKIGINSLRFERINSIKSINYANGINFLFVQDDDNDMVLPEFELNNYTHYQPFSAIRPFINLLPPYKRKVEKS